VLDLLRHGLSDRSAALLRGVSREAVRFHVRNAMGKLGLTSRAALRAWPGIPADGAMSRKERSAVAELGSLGQVARSVRDVEESVAWYRDVLGLHHLYTFGRLAFFDLGGTRLYLQQADPVQPHESVLYLRVDDVHAAFERLRERGVRVRGAPHMIHRHADGTEEWMAFFDDLEGRPLALMAQVGPSTAPTAVSEP
jgi:catechol 2,3-dioxygenase-like lactoylglutathione lyase family enzyme